MSILNCNRLETIEKLEGRLDKGVDLANKIIKNLKQKPTARTGFIDFYGVVDGKYVIECSSWYRYTLMNYTEENIPYIDEIKSFLMDLFDIYYFYQRGIWDAPPLLYYGDISNDEFKDDFTLILRKNY